VNGWSTNYEVNHYVMFYVLLLLHLSYSQIFPSVISSQTAYSLSVFCPYSKRISTTEDEIMVLYILVFRNLCDDKLYSTVASIRYGCSRNSL
jgi:hypothetical protein